jgi:multidrug efflux system outer membrane protein
MRNLLLAGLALLLLCACTIGPDYVRPTVETPASWMVSPDSAADLVNTAWWQ